MKTSKIILILSIIILALGSMIAKADGFKANKAEYAITMNVMVAMQNPMLEATIHQQISPGFLEIYQKVYIFYVSYQDYVVRVYGTYEQWVWFFRPQNHYIKMAESWVKLS